METAFRIMLFLCASALLLAGLGPIRTRSEAKAALPRLETRLFGQSTWMAGSQASLRVIAQNHQTGKPVSRARVEISLSRAGEASGAPVRCYTGRTDARGTTDARFEVPDWPPGQYQLIIVVSGLGERDAISRAVTLQSSAQALLTTDKPLYQPGQTIHIRTLILRQPDQRPLAKAPATLEVEDSKGNKVFKRIAPTSRHGILAADFVLANEINLGRYTIRAIEGQTRQEKTVTVERYVLPKFRVTLTPDRRFYQPGQKLAAKVQADYFFGKPVGRGKVAVTLSKFDAGFQEFARIEGHLDEGGAFTLEQPLPSHFVGQPLEQGNAFVKHDVEVTDTADHTEKISGMVPVAAQPMRITIVPESGRVVPDVENIFYILTTYPDGSPAKARLTLTLANTRLGDTLTTDASGIAEWRFVPREPRVLLRVSAVDEMNNLATVNANITGEWRPGNLILRSDRALYTVGDTMTLSILDPGEAGTVYVDLVRGGQTILTRATSMRSGRASLPIALSQDMAGTLVVHAYRIQPAGQIVRDTRVVFVDPGSALDIDVTADRQTYLPGASARLTFQLRPSRGEPSSEQVFPAALGVSIVDESVFALQEMQPGMEKIYFLLEREILEPRFEIHCITPREIVEPAAYRERSRQRAASVLFAALPRREPFTLIANSYEEKLQKLQEKWQQQARADLERIANALKSYRTRTGRMPEWKDLLFLLVQEGLLTDAQTRDPFGRVYRVNYEDSFLVIASNGPDGKEGTQDDFGAYTGPGGQVAAFQGPGFFTVMKNGRVRRGRLMARPGILMEGIGAMDAMGPVPAPAAQMGMEGAIAESGAAGAAAPAAPEVRVREYFPETLFWNPAILTDERGRATLEVPMADSITTWRLTAMASSPAGLLGSVTAPLRVFQDFFVDIDFPVSLTQNDEVAVPLAVQNWLDEPQRVRLVVDPEPWFELLENPEKSVEMDAREVRGASFRIRVKEIGFHKLTVRAFGSKMSDAVRREVEVVPDGRRIEAGINDRLEGAVRRVVEIPEGAIKGSANILVKIYPGFLSQVVEGMDKILQMPFGCFEQTTSTTYPNVLALDYMRSTNRITPEIQMKAEQYINLGYQRLLTFEVAGGGFSWFGNAPANKVLTAYGLMEFQDMSAVHTVDPALITRTREWLLSQQQPNGSWKPDASYLHEESWGRIQHSELLPTAYIAWALLGGSNAGGQAIRMDPRLAKSIDYIVRHRSAAKDDPYTLGIIANALVSAGRREAGDVLGRLLEIAKEQDGGLFWQSAIPTVTHSHGDAANIEATALVGYALVRSGGYASQANKVITYLVRAKDPGGTWYSTQATVLALKTLLESQKSASRGVEAKVRVRINGSESGAFDITPENADVMRQMDLKSSVRPGRNEIEISFEGKGSSLYQISSIYYLPWEKAPAGEPASPMDIQVRYDRTELEKNDVLAADVTVAYRGPGDANMVMVDLGIPPGFDVLTEDLNELVGSKTIQRFQLTPRQVILYLEKLEHGKPLELRYRMRARFPIRAKTAPSTVYQYYNPEVRSTAPPVELVVR